MSYCIACRYSGNDDAEYSAHGCPSCSCSDELKLFANKIRQKGFAKYGFQEKRNATLFQRRHSFDVKHFYNIYRYDLTGAIPASMSPISFEMEIVFETRDGIWSKINYYGLSEDQIFSKSDELQQRLYKAMLELGGDSETYEPNGK